MTINVDNKLQIQMLTGEHAPLFVEHNARNLLSSGLDGTPIFAISSRHSPYQKAGVVEATSARWALPIGTRGWERVWGCVGCVPSGEPAVFGMVSISTQRLVSSQMHRVILGMGVEPNFRGLGIGRKLMQEMLGWASQQKNIEWIDLGVFAGNAPARRLYEHFGFVETGRINDCFRVDDHRIDDIQMTLNLRDY